MRATEENLLLPSEFSVRFRWSRHTPDLLCLSKEMRAERRHMLLMVLIPCDGVHAAVADAQHGLGFFDHLYEQAPRPCHEFPP